MTSQAKKKPRKRAHSLPSRPTTTGIRTRSGSVDSGTATKDHTVLTDSTPVIQVLDTLRPEIGPELEVPKPIVVRPKKTLDKLYMDTGSLDKILPGSKWPDIAGKLKAHYTAGLKPKDEALAELCTVYYKAGKEAQIKTLPAGLKTDQIPDVVKFLENFMNANGQWDYIKEQDWFKSEGYAIGIEVNYYVNRSGSGTLPGFHKDTAGDNVFVNLIFDNDDTIEGTEWFADVHKPSQARKTWQKTLLPKTYRSALNLARKELGSSIDPAGDVAGGTVGKNAYVSWVDDLVWHATPTAVPRMVFDYDASKEAFTPLYKTVDTDFGYYDDKRKGWILGSELLSTMAEVPGTHIEGWLTKKKLTPQDLDEAQARTAWKELYGDGSLDAARRYFQDSIARAKAAPWRLTGKPGEASAEDPSLPGSRSIVEPAIGLSKRRRANSLPPSSELTKVREANKDKPRNFLRTWIRILPPTHKVTGIDLT